MVYIRSINRFILISLALLGLSISSANAVLIDELSDVNIGGTLYDVKFHSSSGSTFNALWDLDLDGEFDDGDGSVFDIKPTFFGDSAGAKAAAAAIVDRLGAYDTTVAGQDNDGFHVPEDIYDVANPNLPSTRGVSVWFDAGATAGFDSLGAANVAGATDFSSNGPWVSFSAVSPVPVPAAVWLFGTALVGLIGFSKRKSTIAA